MGHKLKLLCKMKQTVIMSDAVTYTIIVEDPCRQGYIQEAKCPVRKLLRYRLKFNFKQTMARVLLVPY